MSLLALALLSGWATANPAELRRGREVYEAACVLCHGKDGAGNPEWESQVRPVSFADCSTTAEPRVLWKSVIANGGRKHGLSDVMPAFGEAFPSEDLDAVVAYLRTFCRTADRYPPGELNFRRLLATDKAFPEAEVAISTTIVPYWDETELEIAYENRLGARFQYGFEFPLRPAPTRVGYRAGVGDLVFSGKYVLSFSRTGRRIVSGGLEVSLPTGNEEKELGTGTTVFLPHLSFAQGFGAMVFQTRLAFDLPADTTRASRAIEYSLGCSLPPIGFPRTGFVPSLELTGIYNPKNSSRENTVVIGVSRALNKLGHLIASVGWGIPLTPSEGPRPKEFRAYLVWDFADGPFWAGW